MIFTANNLAQGVPPGDTLDLAQGVPPCDIRKWVL